MIFFFNHHFTMVKKTTGKKKEHITENVVQSGGLPEKSDRGLK